MVRGARVRLFAQAAQALGLLAPVTQVQAGPDLEAHLIELVRRAGPYPHKAPANCALVGSTRLRRGLAG